MRLVILITAQLEQGMQVAEAWQQAGAPGVTIIRTHGLRTLQDKIHRGAVELPLVVRGAAAAMARILMTEEEQGAMLLSLVDEGMDVTLEQAAQNVLGDLSKPYNGIMMVIDVMRAVGVRDHSQQE
jgi:hypothetical protein